MDRGVTDGLCEVALARAWWAEKQRVFALRDEAPGRELEDELAIHLPVELEIEVVE